MLHTLMMETARSCQRTTTRPRGAQHYVIVSRLNGSPIPGISVAEEMPIILEKLSWRYNHYFWGGGNTTTNYREFIYLVGKFLFH